MNTARFLKNVWPLKEENTLKKREVGRVFQKTASLKLGRAPMMELFGAFNVINV